MELICLEHYFPHINNTLPLPYGQLSYLVDILIMWNYGGKEENGNSWKGWNRKGSYQL